MKLKDVTKSMGCIALNLCKERKFNAMRSAALTADAFLITEDKMLIEM